MRRFSVLLASLLAAGSTQAHPNILFIMSDDHCAQAASAYGGRLARLNPTPTLDRLAREGMLLENCFVTNSICTPSRACSTNKSLNRSDYIFGDSSRKLLELYPVVQAVS